MTKVNIPTTIRPEDLDKSFSGLLEIFTCKKIEELIANKTLLQSMKLHKQVLLTMDNIRLQENNNHIVMATAAPIILTN